MIIKQIFLWGILCFCLCECSSKEDKAFKLVKDYMWQTLNYNDVDSLDISIDSAFTSKYTNPMVINYAQMILNNSIEVTICDNTLASSQNKEEFMFSYTEEDKLFCDTLIQRKKDALNAIYVYSDSIRLLSKDIDKKFQGWRITCNFKGKEQADLNELVFIVDENMRQIFDVKKNNKVAIDLDSIIKRTIDQCTNE